MTLLCSPKVTQHHSQVNAHLSPGKAVFGRGQITRGPQRRYIPQLDFFIGPQIVSSKVSNLRACGADDVTATRAPSAWMIMLSPFLALWQIVFFVWVTLNEHKWVILAERRGLACFR